MIVGNLKPVEEIASSISGFNKVMVIGCGSCVSVCLSGGEKAADRLVHELISKDSLETGSTQFEVGAVLRQCEKDLLRNTLYAGGCHYIPNRISAYTYPCTACLRNRCLFQSVQRLSRQK